ncbi:MAG: hypothetical protein QM750_00910 [Rubrivivax sp.]
MKAAPYADWVRLEVQILLEGRPADAVIACTQKCVVIVRFDRMTVTQAMEERLTLLMAGAALAGYGCVVQVT